MMKLCESFVFYELLHSLNWWCQVFLFS